jgi:hypothetical protein
MALKFQHASAEINTAIREGMYVHLMPPAISWTPKNVTFDPNTGEFDFDLEFDVTPQYEIVPLNPDRIITVDHRNELDRLRSPDYQPAG